MENALIFLAVAVIDLVIVLAAWRLGTNFLIATILANILLTSIFVNKLVPIFGFVTTAAEVFYASIFIATDILSEHHGKKIAYQSIWMGFVALLMLVVLSSIVLKFTTVSDSVAIADAMETLFTAVPRVAIASFTAYLIAQRFDIWFFHFLKQKTNNRKLWLRNNASTITSQALDSLIFFPLAFYGTVATSTLLMLIATGWLFKIPIAIIDTPIMYLSYWVKGKTPPDFQKIEKKKEEDPAAGLI